MCLNEIANKEPIAPKESKSEPTAEEKSSAKINTILMEFFDVPENWSKSEIKTGRSWRMDELRIKSNQDLHKLWYILYKERNMLLTMKEAAKRETETMPSPERIEKVEESMKNIEDVVIERNKAYWELEVGDSQYATRRRAFRSDQFGRFRWIACSEHLIPYWMNTKWREMNGPGYGPDVFEFQRKLKEKLEKRDYALISRQAFYCRQLMKRFDTLDLEYLQEKFPNVNVQFIKKTLDEHVALDRPTRFHSLLYNQKKLE